MPKIKLDEKKWTSNLGKKTFFFNFIPRDILSDVISEKASHYLLE